jgi:ubiquinone/menaquinone biosynthesis C-methylase UbiE
MDEISTESIKRRYNRMAPLFHRMDGKSMREWRKSLLSQAKGSVLEIGIGTGANLPYYGDDVQLTGIDFSPNMLQYARKKASEMGMSVTLLEMDAQQLQFPDNSFDFVVATCVFCSVPDPVRGMKEMLRVCKLSGKVLLLEHMRSENPYIGKLMDWVNPLTVRVSGANINRRTLDNIETAGFLIEKNQRLLSSIVRHLELLPVKPINNDITSTQQERK